MFKRLLVPIDGSELSDRAIAAALELAVQLQAEVIGFVVELHAPLPAAGMHLSSLQRAVNEHEAGTEDHARRLLAGFAARARKAGVSFEGHHAHDDAIAAAIVHAAERHAADLILMVTHGRGLFGQLFFGSHTKQVMALTKKPLLVIH